MTWGTVFFAIGAIVAQLAAIFNDSLVWGLMSISAAILALILKD